MKYWLSVIGLFLLIFLCAFIFSFIYIFSIVNLFIKFNLLSALMGLLIPAIGSLIISILVLGYEIIRFNSRKKTKLSNWISMNYPKLILYYVISSICFVSIKNEIVWSYQELKDALSLEWTIFGISITIFLVWDILILKHLKVKKPQIESHSSPIKKLKYIEKKGDFYTKASTIFNSITLLSINLFALIFASASVYIVWHEINLLNQNAIIISFYFCTNALIDLFLDILQPLNEEKKEILRGTKISQEEVTEHNQLEEKTTRLITVLEEIAVSTVFSDEEKEQIKTKLILEYTGIKQIESSIEIDSGNENKKDLE